MDRAKDAEIQPVVVISVSVSCIVKHPQLEYTEFHKYHIQNMADIEVLHTDPTEWGS